MYTINKAYYILSSIYLSNIFPMIVYVLFKNLLYCQNQKYLF